MRSEQLDALRPIVNRWLPAVVTAVDPQVQKIAAEIVEALDSVTFEAKPVTEIELEKQRLRNEELERQIEDLGSEAAAQRVRVEQLCRETEAHDAARVTAEQTRDRLAAASDELHLKHREALADREREIAHLTTRAEEAERDREQYLLRARSLEIVASKLLANAHLVADRRPIDDWEKVLRDAEFVLNGGSL